MKIFFAASECAPFAKTGGLADVVSALSQRLAQTGDDVRVIMPLYQDVAARWRKQTTHRLSFYVNLGWRRQYCGIEELDYNGVKVYFVDNEYYFNRASLYGYGDDDGERYAFFCRAVLEAMPLLDFKPDVLHCHDWQSGMVPALLREQYGSISFYKGIRTVFTIHNLQYQGVFGIGYVDDLMGFGAEKYTDDKLEFYGCTSFMKAGLVYSDAITTVSRSYAEEIQTAYFGERLDGLLRARAADLSGVVNGIDTNAYNPMTDTMIYKNFSAETWKKDKAINKKALQSELGLELNPNAPIICMITRLSPQKGLDLVERVFDGILREGVQFAVLGVGDERFVNFFAWSTWRYGGRVAMRNEMNEALAHRIYASCDMLLMPSQFEPCGLAQMIAMRYGTVPIVRETGGLRDTVLSYNEETGEGNGFTFFNYNAHDMLSVIARAVGFYRDNQEAWETLVLRGMRGEYGWDQSAAKYQDIYRRLLAQENACADADAGAALEESLEADLEALPEAVSEAPAEED